MQFGEGNQAEIVVERGRPMILRALGDSVDCGPDQGVSRLDSDDRR